MTSPAKVGLICESPPSRAAWTAFLSHCPNLIFRGGFQDVRSFLAARDECTAILVVSTEPALLESLRDLPAGIRLVCLGARASAVPAHAVKVPEHAAPSALLDALRGREGCPLRLPLRDGSAQVRKEHGLTSKETEVLTAICRGLSLKDVAAAEGYTVSTVETRLKRVMKKLGVSTRPELLLRAATLGIIPCPCRLRRA